MCERSGEIVCFKPLFFAGTAQQVVVNDRGQCLIIDERDQIPLQDRESGIVADNRMQDDGRFERALRRHDQLAAG